MNALSGYPLCCPALTGTYPHRRVRGHEHRLPPEARTIAHAFREHGYHTA